MAVDKLVDSTQLDTDLTSVANAIRTKGGTSASLAFPAGFVSAVNAIPTGGGGTPLSANGFTVASANQSYYPDTGYGSFIQTAKSPVLTNSWDFTESLVDSIGGLSVTLSNGATRDSEGLKISGSTQYAALPLKWEAYKTYEIDFASASRAFSSGHGRVFVFSDRGFVWYNGSTGYWSTYMNKVWSGNGGTTAFSNNTISIKAIPIQRRVNTSTANPLRIRIKKDDTEWIFPENAESASTVNLTLGSSSSSFYNMVITGFRVYDGVEF